MCYCLCAPLRWLVNFKHARQTSIRMQSRRIPRRNNLQLISHSNSRHVGNCSPLTLCWSVKTYTITCSSQPSIPPLITAPVVQSRARRPRRRYIRPPLRFCPFWMHTDALAKDKSIVRKMALMLTYGQIVRYLFKQKSNRKIKPRNPSDQNIAFRQ